jgi:hypothetical protein
MGGDMGRTEENGVRSDFVLYGLIGGDFARVRILEGEFVKNGDRTVKVMVLDGPYQGKSGNIKTERLLVQDGLF